LKVDLKEILWIGFMWLRIKESDGLFLSVNTATVLTKAGEFLERLEFWLLKGESALSNWLVG